MKKRALYLGRFQPLHLGHWWMIRHLSEHYDVVLAIGSSEAPLSASNPFSCAERVEMITRTFLAAGLSVPALYEVPDIPEDDAYVDHVIGIVGAVDLLVSAEQDWTRDLFAKRGYEIEYVGRQQRISATEVRRRMRMGEDWQSLLPRPVAEFLEELGAEQRLRELEN